MVIAVVTVDQGRLNSINDEAVCRAADVAVHETSERLRASSCADLLGHHGGNGAVVVLFHTAEAGGTSGVLAKRGGEQHLGEGSIGATTSFEFVLCSTEDALNDWVWRSAWARNGTDLLLQLPSRASDAARPKLPQMGAR